MEAATYNFPSIRSGNTFSARTWNTTLDLTGTVICFQFRLNRYDVLDIPVNIDDANNFTFGGFPFNVSEGTFPYDMVFTLADGTTRTFFQGSITVLKTISKCQ